MKTHKITLLGRVPTKKNGKKAFGRRVVIDPAIKSEIAFLTLQVRSQWKREPVERAAVAALFHVSDGRSDLDGKLTTILDCLVQGGALRNDSIARVKTLAAEAIIDPEGERVVIEIREAA
jgi:Holliday junction resolvase RusA-like endonuclease